MASAGGHWVKAASGPIVGTMVFVSAGVSQDNAIMSKAVMMGAVAGMENPAYHAKKEYNENDKIQITAPTTKPTPVPVVEKTPVEKLGLHLDKLNGTMQQAEGADLVQLGVYKAALQTGSYTKIQAAYDQLSPELKAKVGPIVGYKTAKSIKEYTAQQEAAKQAKAQADFAANQAKVQAATKVAQSATEAALLAAAQKGNFTGTTNAGLIKSTKEGYSQTPFTPGELSAISTYQDGGYGSINNVLWGKGGGDTATAQNVQALAAAMAKAPGAPKNMVVYRGKGYDSELHLFAKSATVGSVYQALGHESTTVSQKFAASWGAGAVTAKYNVPKGLKGIYLNALGTSTHGFTSSHKSEQEWLMDKNIQWRVVSKGVSALGKLEIEFEFAGFVQ